MATLTDSIEVDIGPYTLRGFLGIPRHAAGLIIFAHGSGSDRLSPRNNRVAAALRDDGLGTLLLDLLTPAEERERANVFDIALLASRLSSATDWALAQSETANSSIGYFGASTGAGAALMAAGVPRSPVAAAVSRGGRPDLAGDALPRVTAPTLLVVGSLDTQILQLNRMAYDRLASPKELTIVEGATHLFRSRARWMRSSDMQCAGSGAIWPVIRTPRLPFPVSSRTARFDRHGLWVGRLDGRRYGNEVT
jgi:putative phosphoribosyl transferase